jgi:predicted Zn-dependent protease
MGRKSREKQLRRLERDSHRPLRRGPQAVREFGFEITDEPMEDDAFPDDIADQADELFADSIDHPDRGIPRLEELVEKYPEIPTLKNWLSTAYTRAGRKDDAERVVRRTFSEHPDYLFARIAYAQLCLDSGRQAEVPALFNGKTELNHVLTDRNLFHITEFTAFYFVIAKHALMTGDFQTARRCYHKLMRGAPDSEAFQVLQELVGGFLSALLRESERPSSGPRPAARFPNFKF